jgi:AraC-like DNA-binding protein
LWNALLPLPASRQENFAGAKVREALDYLETHYADPDLSMQTLCKDLYISTSYLSANLKRYHDKTFVEHLTDIRIRKAKELLRTTPQDLRDSRKGGLQGCPLLQPQLQEGSQLHPYRVQEPA